MGSENFLPPEAIEALQRGQKIEAIKRLRDYSGLDLKEARAAVEAHIGRDPALKAKVAQAQAASARRGTIGLLIFAVLAILAYRWLAGG
ncbi:ribosomal protein L7/L12 [Rehaibacterium terrae]|jgi:hypothetical protein|uniref:Large ribosomal subunit protein bL12 C-terminal domain-containing protein n=1 Tax=Rehaibacterium terrae TaxID=1341696 RepID=A0A7W7V8A2_9GAMM|nr:ribosomal protein L7/L12 [Rehaibacterium terrae]MBB5014131.1 hypothetical protein [Rehaibacterium terrae]